MTKKYKIPSRKPPVTANDKKIRKGRRIVFTNHKIPDFLEPYEVFVPNETPESPIKLNQEEDLDTYSVDSDTSYEYEPAEYRSTGLNVALPQLYSIVKSYGNNIKLN